MITTNREPTRQVSTSPEAGQNIWKIILFITNQSWSQMFSLSLHDLDSASKRANNLKPHVFFLLLPQTKSPFTNQAKRTNFHKSKGHERGARVQVLYVSC